MGQPTPPGDAPLYEGLGVEWNDIVGAFPEERRSDLAPLLKTKLDAYEPLKQYSDLHKSGITAEQASNALNIYTMLEQNPRQVYEEIGKHLGITTQQAQQLVNDQQQNQQETDTEVQPPNFYEDPRFQTLAQQVETLSKIMLGENAQRTQQQQQAEADAALNKELETLKQKYGDFDEEEVVMRMLHKNLDAEAAYQEFAQKTALIRQRRVAPLLLNSGGQVVPRNNIDPTKLDTKDTRSLVAQMMQNGLSQQ